MPLMSHPSANAEPNPYAAPSLNAEPVSGAETGIGAESGFGTGAHGAFTSVGPDYGAHSYQAPAPYPAAISGYGHYSAPADFSKLNTYSILALVFAFVFAPLGIVFGALARPLAKAPGAPAWMKTVANAGFWISLSLTALPLLLGLTMLLTSLVVGARGFGGSNICVTSPDGVTTCQRGPSIFRGRGGADPVLISPVAPVPAGA